MPKIPSIQNPSGYNPDELERLINRSVAPKPQPGFTARWLSVLPVRQEARRSHRIITTAIILLVAGTFLSATLLLVQLASYSSSSALSFIFTRLGVSIGKFVHFFKGMVSLYHSFPRVFSITTGVGLFALIGITILLVLTLVGTQKWFVKVKE